VPPLELATISGGGRDRTRVSSDPSWLSHNDSHQRVERLAALWLQSLVTDQHDLARIVTLAEVWFSLPETIKIKIEKLKLSRVKNSNLGGQNVP